MERIRRIVDSCSALQVLPSSLHPTPKPSFHTVTPCVFVFVYSSRCAGHVYAGLRGVALVGRRHRQRAGRAASGGDARGVPAAEPAVSVRACEWECE